MSNQKNVLEILKENKDGLTIPDLDTLYESKYGRRLGHSLYSYLHRLMHIEVVEQFIPKIRTGKLIGYKATEKAWEEERREEALELLEIFKNMTNRGAIKYYKGKITQDEIDKLEGF